MPMPTDSTPSFTRTTPFEMLPELLTVSEFASVPGVGKGVIYSLVQAGALPVVKFGRLIRIQKTALHRSQQD